MERTGQDGSFRFPPAAEEHRIVITHPSGFAAMSVGELPESGKIPLQAWARVEGVLKSGGHPVARERVALRSPLSWMDVENYRFMYSATTDKAGRFVFTNITAGEHLLYRIPRMMSGASFESHRLPFTVKAGETKRTLPEIAEVAPDGSVVVRQRWLGTFTHALDLRSRQE